MSKLPSEATQIKKLNREIKRLHGQWHEAARQRDAHAAKISMLQAQVQEWKDRFDILLRAAKLTAPVGKVIQLSSFVNGAGITASDTQVQVIEKLQASMDRTR